MILEIILLKPLNNLNKNTLTFIFIYLELNKRGIGQHKKQQLRL